MEYDFSDIIVQEVRQAEPDLDARLEAQAEALNELECSNVVIGRWIEEFGLEYLQAAFALNDKEFVESFPGLAHINRDDRETIIETFNHHVDACVHCSRRTSYDTELDSRINRAIHSGHAGKDKVIETPNEPHHYCASECLS